MIIDLGMFLLGGVAGSYLTYLIMRK